MPTTSQQVVHTTDRSSQTQSLKRKISQHLQKLNKKHSPKKELQRHQPKRAHQPNAKMATQENNEYLVQQQNRVQYRTISKYKTHDRMEKTSETNNIKQTENVSKVTFVCTARKHTVSTMYAASTIHASMQHITHNIVKIIMHRARSNDKIYSERSQARGTREHGNKHTATQCSKIRTLHRRSIGEQQMTHVLNSP